MTAQSQLVKQPIRKTDHLELTHVAQTPVHGIASPAPGVDEGHFCLQVLLRGELQSPIQSGNGVQCLRERGVEAIRHEQEAEERDTLVCERDCHVMQLVRCRRGRRLFEVRHFRQIGPSLQYLPICLFFQLGPMLSLLFYQFHFAE